MFRMLGLTCFLTTSVLAGCDSPEDGGLVAVEHNALAITQVVIDHDVVSGERVMTARGLDQDGQQIATATLRTGTVLYGADVEPTWNAGTELVIAVGDASRTYVAPDRLAHEEQLPTETDLATFVRLEPVSAAIAQEAGIRFAEPAIRGDEIAYAAENCDGAHFPSDKGNPSQCCRDGANTYFKIPSGPSANRLGWRQLNASMQACRASDGVTTCSDAACTYGPCAAKINSVSGTNNTSAVVFTPSNPALCGADGNGTASAGADPTGAGAYIGSEAIKPGVTSTCTYTNCISGIPGNQLTVYNSDTYVTVTGLTVAGYPGDIETYGSESAYFASTTAIRVTAFNASANVEIMGACQANAFKIVACTIPAGTMLHDDFVYVSAY